MEVGVVSRECKAAMALSLRVKKEEAKLRCLHFWGRVVAANGRDYLLARGSPVPPSVSNRSVTHLSKFYYSQDGVQWMDLQEISEEVYNACKDLHECFTGEPSHMYSNSQSGDQIMNDDENQESVDDTQVNEENDESSGDMEQEDEEIEQDDGENINDDNNETSEETKTTSKLDANKPLKIGELERLSALMKHVDYDCGVIPKGALVLDANKNLVENVHFPGCWSIEVLLLQGVVLRSLWWPGYTFYYDIATKKFESVYFGLGLKNINLPFMV